MEEAFLLPKRPAALHFKQQESLVLFEVQLLPNKTEGREPNGSERIIGEYQMEELGLAYFSHTHDIHDLHFLRKITGSLTSGLVGKRRIVSRSDKDF